MVPLSQKCSELSHPVFETAHGNRASDLLCSIRKITNNIYENFEFNRENYYVIIFMKILK